MFRDSVTSVLFTAWLVLASGCDRTISPIDVAPGCPDRPVRAPEQWASTPATQLIDDFESGDGRVAREEGRDGEWVLSVDRVTGTTASAATASRCAGRGLWAGHFTTSASSDWGAMWTAGFRTTASGNAQPYDGSQYGGISFWAGLDAANGAPAAIRVGVVTMDTAWNGGLCSKYCMDFHGIEVTPDMTWRRFEIRFDKLRQQGWGDVQTSLRRDQLVGFVVWPNHACDLWLDDVRFEP
jgi:hypothetical protein